MVRVRIFEERVSELFVQGGTAGSMLHLSIGEEAGAVGVMGAMREGDGFTTHHRGHGIFLARGADTKKMMAEIAGKTTGYCRGKGGSMHIADRGLGHLGANAIVGGGISHVVGAGLTYQMKHHGNAAVAFFGDGAMQQGVLYESMNLSALWKLPVMFVCVNNEYGMGTRLDHASASLEFEKRAETFGLMAAEVDGIDVFEVYNQSKNLLEDVRKGKPAFLKVNSYRFHGHARMDKSPYRDQQEEEEGRKKDAIAFLRDRIIKSGWSQETECDAIVEEVKQEMDEALNHARNAADPGADEMYEDVFDPQTTKPFPVDSRIRESLHLPQA
ncbi:MAG: thiamine pyrophosphate-dependent dehydrogenase E1 component subunit alpha [SAR324 cluster bacterium]|nr:thiamine pyrophosphate-dependent dehydrogenase E1 component subunit alpha [SAR324 cluster bacterium]